MKYTVIINPINLEQWSVVVHVYVMYEYTTIVNKIERVYPAILHGIELHLQTV